MKHLLFLFSLCILTIGCGYEDPRPDPKTDPDYVDTTDPNVVLGQQAEERKEGSKKEK